MIAIRSREFDKSGSLIPMYKWLAINCIGKYELSSVGYASYTTTYNEFEFERKDDAMHFKLVWG
jgi:hypothetical protein